ncbi:MAG: Gfo/Idh/MocA family oxidoreductase, partial [Chitinophagaceae bacterium]
MDRKTFLLRSGGAVAGTLIGQTAIAGLSSPAKQRIAMVGTGVRGIGMWGAPVIREFSDLVEFVGLCDANPGRVETAKKKLGLSCPTFTDFDKMMRETKPDRLLVMTVDGVHHEFIAKGMEYGADIISEKPMTIDEQKCQTIIDAEQKTGKKLTVTFNYRYSPHRQKLYELLRNDA